MIVKSLGIYIQIYQKMPKLDYFFLEVQIRNTSKFAPGYVENQINYYITVRKQLFFPITISQLDCALAGDYNEPYIYKFSRKSYSWSDQTTIYSYFYKTLQLSKREIQ